MATLVHRHWRFSGQCRPPLRRPIIFWSFSSEAACSNSKNNNYVKNPTKYWDNFYKRHENKFFKDRHYLEKDWGRYLYTSGNERKIVLEVGCGAGNAIFPLISAFPNVFVYACDLSSHAIELTKEHGAFCPGRVNSFVFDVTKDDLSTVIMPSSVDVVTMIFMFSAVTPSKMSSVLQNIKKILKPNGFLLFRDYAIGDYAQIELAKRDRLISENFYVRGDGTCVFYFSEDSLSTLFESNGFSTIDISIYHREIVNRLQKVVMDRRWIRAAFCNTGNNNIDQKPCSFKRSP